MILIQIAFDLFVIGAIWALWTCYQKIAESHYNLAQWTKQELDKK